MCGLLCGNICLDDEILATVFCETEAIVNGSRKYICKSYGINSSF